MLKNIIEATADRDDSSKESQVVAPDGTRVTPGRMGVDPGNQPVMSLAEFAKKF